ncbi:MAG: hypothetical protein AB7O97_22500 [Planctomycetota bacterium]
MAFDAASLFSGLVLSSIGIGLFVFGRKQRRAPQLLAGVTLMVLPVLPIWLWCQWLLAALVGVGTVLATRAGW